MKYKPRDRQLSSPMPMENSIGRDQDAIMLPLLLIDPGANIRKDPKGIDELAASIQQHGLLQPLVVRKNVPKFELVAGHRRYLALQSLGMKEAPCRVIGADENGVMVLRLVENLQREDLTGWEACKAIHALLPLFRGNQARLAEAINKDPSYVSHATAVIQANLDHERVHGLPLRDLYQLASKKKQVGKLEPDPKVQGIKPETKALIFRETKSKGWSIRYDPTKASDDDKMAVIQKLQELLTKLRP